MVATLAGCAQAGPFTERHTMIGSLRSSVAQLESEKYQLQKQVAEARAESRRLEDRLVEEEAHGQALAKQLSDVKRLVRNSGPDPIDLSGPTLDDFPPAPPLPDDPRQRPAPEAARSPSPRFPARSSRSPTTTRSPPATIPPPTATSTPSDLFPSQGGFGSQSRLDSAALGLAARRPRLCRRV